MPRLSLTSDELDSMRNRLCEAALVLFSDKGLEGVTFRALAEALGISHTLPYRYFDSKDALLAAVRLMCFERFGSFVREREPKAGSPLQGVLSVVDSYADFVREYPTEYVLIFASTQPPPLRFPRLLAARKHLFEHCVDLVQCCVEQNLVRGDARQVAHGVWASLHGLLSLHVANQLVHGCGLDELLRPTINRILGVPEPAAGKRPKLKPVLAGVKS